MQSSYNKDEVILLLKDITGMVEPLENAEREKRIQSGVHYSEMLPKEHLPSREYRETFLQALRLYSAATAKAVEILCDRIIAEKGRDAVLVSLARAGTPIGVLMKRCIKWKYGADVMHYSVSIIRGKGIDKNAVNYILSRHPAEKLQFVDGWTGKGAIRGQLKEAMLEYKGIDDSVAVLSDPAYVAGKCGTHRDFLIPSSCLNSTVSGLVSRTFYRSDIIGENDFHGAAYYSEFEHDDLTATFLDSVTEKFGCDFTFDPEPAERPDPYSEVLRIKEIYNISDVNFVKPGLGEATRVMLRRIPWKILVHSLDDNEYLGHIYRLAEEKNVELEVFPLKCYKACGLIKAIADT